MARVIITQIKSTNNANKNHIATIRALGLKKIGQTVEHEATTFHYGYGSPSRASGSLRRSLRRRPDMKINEIKSSPGARQPAFRRVGASELVM